MKAVNLLIVRWIKHFLDKYLGVFSILPLLCIMLRLKHSSIYLTQATHSNELIQSLIRGNIAMNQLDLSAMKPAIFSTDRLNEFLNEEFLHGTSNLSSGFNRPLHSLSSGEQKKALLNHLIFQDADYFILDQLYDHVDVQGRASMLATIQLIAQTKPVIQLVHRQKEILPFVQDYYCYQAQQLVYFENNDLWQAWMEIQLSKTNNKKIPKSINQQQAPTGPLVKLIDVCVSYEEKPILNSINWTIEPGECWQLMGPNGSGKSTLLSLITGDNPKGFGQELFLFGRKKGSGESVWDIKQYIGYFNHILIQHFSRLDSIENMIVSGCLDSIGLYIKPSEMQLRVAHEWLEFLDLISFKNKPIQYLTPAQQRMVLIARAMVKHPPLLILDEPTSGLDDAGASLVVGMIQQVIAETNIAVLFVSHQKEPGFEPKNIFELIPSKNGSTGGIKI